MIEKFGLKDCFLYIKMSYVEICDKFEEVVNYLTQTHEETANLSKFFGAYRRITDNYAGQLGKLAESLMVSMNPEVNLNTLSMALLTFKEHVQRVAESHVQLVKSLQLDVIEPLDLFTEHFVLMFAELKNKGLSHYKELKFSQEKMNKSRNEYYRTSNELEKYSRLGMVEDSKEKQDQNQKIITHLSMLQETHLDNYIKGIVDVNSCWDTYDKYMPQIMEDLQQNEESRIHFMRNSLEKYIRYYQKLQVQNGTSLEKLGEIFMNINSSIDVRVFVDLYKSKNLVMREQFVNYDDWKSSISDKDTEVIESDQFIVSNALNTIISHQNEKSSGIESGNFEKLSEVISTSEGRKIFIEILQSKMTQPYLSYHAITQIAALLKEILSLMVKENEYDASIFCNIISSSVNYYTAEKGRKKTLSNFISPHYVWTDRKRWLQAIDYAVSAKAATKEPAKQKKVSKLFQFFSSKANPAAQEIEKVSAYAILSQFIFHMAKLKLPEMLSSSIILDAAQQYNIEKERKILLISELQARSSLPIAYQSKLPPRDRTLSFYIKKSAKFFTLNEILEFSKVNNHWKSMLCREKYKRMLLHTDAVNKNPKLRETAWLDLLGVENIDQEYFNIVAILELSSNLLGELNEIIDMDVVRSFQKNEAITDENLKNILKVYAYMNKELGYCQGMNYIAGTIFLVLHSESIACQALSAMIDKFSMTSLFTHKLKKLKKLFYILDRLTSFIYPEINEIFKDAWVFSDNYSSAWFMTVFSSIFHFRFDVLVKIWDVYFVYGWKGLFKICLGILKSFEDKLVDKSFEDIMFILGGLANAEIFDDDFFKKAMLIPVSNRMISSIKKEYKIIIQ